METLPGDVRLYDATRELSEETVPAGLLRRHTTKAGVWARIVVLEGVLLYRVLEPEPREHRLEPGTPGIVAPRVPHEVEPRGPVRFRVEFLRALLVACLLFGLAGTSQAGMRAKFELFVNDAAASTSFYQALGFRVAHRKESDGYTTMEQDGVVVALSPLPRWLPIRWLGFLRLPPFGTEIVLYPDSLEAARRALLAAGYEPGEVHLQSWGHRDFRLRDPDGYYVRVSEGSPLPEAD